MSARRIDISMPGKVTEMVRKELPAIKVLIPLAHRCFGWGSARQNCHAELTLHHRPRVSARAGALQLV